MIPVLAPTEAHIHRAAEALHAGRLVGMPTETVYGLAGNAFDPLALARIFEVKRRPFFDPLIVHVSEASEVEGLWQDLPAEARLLMDAFWPGPLTLALPKTARVPELVTAGLDTVAVRMPAHPVARALLHAAGVPLAAPSANPFGGLSPTLPEHVAKAFERMSDDSIDCVLDGGPCSVGVESTVVGWEDGRAVLLRAGGVTREALEVALGKPVGASTRIPEGAHASPGTLEWHYAPRTPLRILDSDILPQDAITSGRIAFGPGSVSGSWAQVVNLSPSGDLREAAATLFATLHRLDALDLTKIYAVTVPESGLGLAINERLRKAAAAPPHATRTHQGAMNSP